jgi:hypothetical protein
LTFCVNNDFLLIEVIIVDVLKFAKELMAYCEQNGDVYRYKLVDSNRAEIMKLCGIDIMIKEQLDRVVFFYSCACFVIEVFWLF